jgi:hypothetical protein
MWQQLEITNDLFAAVVNPPENYFEILGGVVAKQKSLAGLNAGRFDVIHLFETDAEVLKDQIMEALFSITPWGMIWVSWLINEEALHNSISADDIRRSAQSLGLVDEKIIEFDKQWWAMKLIPATQ